MKGWSAAGLILYLITMTHAGYDWAMSRDTDFYSTAFGLIMTVGQTLSALAFAILVVWLIHNVAGAPAAAELYRKPEQNPPEFGSPSVLNDVGNILLTLVILWAYISFMQFLVIWMGNSGEDNGYYLKRGIGQPSVWRWIGLGLITVHFFIPFFLLLFRATKNYLPALTVVAGIVFVAHGVEQYWLIAPSPDLKGPHFALTWMDLLMPFAIGGVWLAAFFTLLASSLAAGGVPSIQASWQFRTCCPRRDRVMSERAHGHEISGVNVRGVGVFFAYFVATGSVILIGLWFLMGKIVHHVDRGGIPRSSLRQTDVFAKDQPLQPSPGHPTLDWQDAAAMKAEQTRPLNTYGRIPGDSSHVRIPIGRAMHLIVEKQLLTHPSANTQSASTQPYINTTQPTTTENRT